jgi:formylglycine-generating enzyme required for sulfatase activity
MKCSHCNEDLKPGAKFCNNCGAPQSQPEPMPKNDSGIRNVDIGYMEGNLTDASVRGSASVGNVYIGAQATDSSVLCPLCGARNVLTATFRCMQCGQDHLCRAHLNQQHYMCAICARQVEQEAAASTPQTRSQEPEFCPSCGGVIADDCFLCKKCEKINCGSCRDDRRRGWCVGCGEEHDRRQFEKTAQQQQKLEQLTLAIERSISTGELDDARHGIKLAANQGLSADQLARLETAVKQAAEPQHGDKISTPSGMEFVYIEHGTFMMGSPGNEARDNDETQHVVTLTQGFYLQTTPVTQGQWHAVMGSNPSRFKDGGQDRPVETVSWNNVQDFIQKLNAMEPGAGYQLPTEAQWEYACRAGSSTVWCFGNDDDYLGRYAWYDYNSEDQTHPVGKKQPNNWGLYDMHGNVSEWCQDWYGDYPSASVADPGGPSDGSTRVYRGGSFQNCPLILRCACRGETAQGNLGDILGFRLARTP